MNKEVKELIDRLKDNANSDDYDENGYFFALYISDKDLLLDHINQLETNRDELKKWLEEFQEDICYDTDGEYFFKDENMEIKVQYVLDKMQELERGKE